MPADPRPLFKVCGLTRLCDVRLAESVGAAYLGFIFAPSRRRVSLEWAQALMQARDAWQRERPGGARARRVGVFGDGAPDGIAGAAERLALDVVQLHGSADGHALRELRARTSATIWSVVPVEGGRADERALAVALAADGVVLDARVGGQVGGTGVPFDWEAVARALEPLRGSRPIILAGGLTASNVGAASSVLRPDVVDVSSGVESRPGRKDPERLQAFAHAVKGVVAA